MTVSGPRVAGGAETNVVLGSARAPDGERVPVMAPVDAVVRHGAVIGASGCGKTAWTLGLIVQLLLVDARLPIIVLDPKNDLAGGLTLFLAALAGSLPAASQKMLIDGFRLVAPFRDPALALNLLAREPGVEPELQALAVMDALQSALDDDLAGFARITSALQVVLTAAIEVGLKLTDLPKLLLDADFRRGVEARLPQGRTREMLATRIKATAATSIAALVARLDRLLASPLVRRLVSADGCFSFRDRLDAGVTLVDIGSPPDGLRALQKLLGSWFVQRLSAALLSRNVAEKTPPLLVVIDELPEVVSGRAAEEVGRLLALVRYKRVGLNLLFQDENQLAKAPELLALIKANCSRLTVFRGNPQSLRWVEPFLPQPILHAASPLQKPPNNAADAMARQLLMRMADLENRVCLHVDRAAGEHGVFMSTPFFDFADIERRAKAAPAHVRAVLNGEAVPGAAKNASPMDEENDTKNSPKDAAANDPRVDGREPAREVRADKAAADNDGGADVEREAQTARTRAPDATKPSPSGEKSSEIPCSLGWVPWAPPPGGAR